MFTTLRQTLDSPTLLRDVTSLLSPWRAGFWLTVLNLVLGCLLGSMVVAAALVRDRTISMMSSELGLGQYLASMLLLGLGGICTLLVPIRAAGLFDGPRLGRYFDQLVLTGVSPIRYFAGKVLAMNMFFAFIVAASLPYAIFSVSLGGTRPSYMLCGTLALWLYANLLTFTTLAGTVHCNDAAAAVITILLFAGAFCVGLAPLPPISGILTPSHYLISPLWNLPLAVRGVRWGINSTPITIGSVSFAVSSFGVFAAGGLTACAVAAAVLVLGPVHCLVQVNSTFGEVVMPGDGKRPSVLRRRRRLRRRSEVAFFYENQSPWILRYEALIRYLGGPGLLLSAAAIAFGVLHGFSGKYRPDDFYVANLITFASCVFVACVFFSSDRCTAYTHLRLRSHSASVARLDTLGFIVFTALLCAMAWGIPAWRCSVEGLTWFRRGTTSLGKLAEAQRIHRAGGLILLMLVQCYALGRWLGTRRWDRGGAVTLSALLMGAFWAAPVAVANGLMILSGRPGHMTPTARRLAMLSPILYLEDLMDGKSRAAGMLATAHVSMLHITPALHILVALMLMVAATMSYTRLRQGTVLGSALEELGAAAADAPAEKPSAPPPPEAAA